MSTRRASRRWSRILLVGLKKSCYPWRCTWTNPELTRRKIATFWLPLFSTWLMMGVEGPFIAAVIARLAEAKFNLAAFGVAFSLGMFFESPIIMMLSAANVLVKDRRTYLKLRRFNNLLNLLITLAMLLVLVPPVFYWLTERLIGMPPEVARLTRQATLVLLPWPAAIGYRRFYQGHPDRQPPAAPRGLRHGRAPGFHGGDGPAALSYFRRCPAPAWARPPCRPEWSWRRWPAASWPGRW